MLKYLNVPEFVLAEELPVRGVFDDLVLMGMLAIVCMTGMSIPNPLRLVANAVVGGVVEDLGGNLVRQPLDRVTQWGTDLEKKVNKDLKGIVEGATGSLDKTVSSFKKDAGVMLGGATSKLDDMMKRTMNDGSQMFDRTTNRLDDVMKRTVEDGGQIVERATNQLEGITKMAVRDGRLVMDSAIEKCGLVAKRDVVDPAIKSVDGLSTALQMTGKGLQNGGIAMGTGMALYAGFKAVSDRHVSDNEVRQKQIEAAARGVEAEAEVERKKLEVEALTIESKEKTGRVTEEWKARVSIASVDAGAKIRKQETKERTEMRKIDAFEFAVKHIADAAVLLGIICCVAVVIVAAVCRVRK
jgi:hypothetical protein